MNYERLKTFITVAEKKSFSEAAKILFVTQPTITSQIKALEVELRTKLFERTTKKVQMTQSAKILLKYAREIVRMNDLARKDILHMEGTIYGELGMGCSLTIGEYILPNFLKEFKEAYPLIQIQVNIANSEFIVDSIKNEFIDVGLVETPIEDNQIELEPFLEDELVLIATPDYFPSNDPWISWEQVEQSPLIFREEGSGTRSVVNHYMEKAGLSMNDLNIVMELGSTEAIKAVVESGLGVSFISKNAIKKEQKLKLLKAYSISNMKLKRHFYVAYKKNHVLKSVTELFLDDLCGKKLEIDALQITETSW
ncbi:selenium metabolism-associated LysR family transcriptional regulator [Oceanobacillus jeddahense]|uniref:Selenium metabolism-associated LysR family transcriptional regulator n=1 Tax=Oceanobacillus jeddahense TaxID=1462527 RepID=A0ABY5JTU2_9BACI|nr:selenium metabolism-associated LysR family transcriptional regulator [Oceanobacillus jeddahense]UUI03755.1 selenium metabolism-associated LysR family transcriptional regulator [Oceanobacillus jeddahense]